MNMKKIRNYFNKNKLTISFIIFTLSIALFLLIFAQIESDYFWHIKAGKYMFNHGVLKHDIFSWYLNSKYWMSHEWLFEIIIYLLSIIFPKYHILVYSFISLSSLLLILFFTNKKEYLKNIPFSMLWVSLSLILIMYIQGRPFLLSFILLALSIFLLFDNYKNKDSNKIFFLPIISMIWANVHGGSSNLSYIFGIIFLIGSLFNFKTAKVESVRISKKQIVKYLIVIILCMISININIHGFKMFIYPYQNMLDKTMLTNISEWAPTNLNNIGHFTYILFIIFILFIMLFSKKKINFLDLILFGVCIILGLKSIRFWGYTYIIMSFVIFNYISNRKLDKGTNLTLIFISIILIMSFIMNLDMLNNNLNKRYISNNLVKLIKEEKPKRLFNMYDYGGELIYNDMLVFVDGRADLYSKYNYKDYLNISMLNSDYIKLIDKYNFDYFLVDKKYPISTYLKYNSNYKDIYHDKHIILYKKDS